MQQVHLAGLLQLAQWNQQPAELRYLKKAKPAAAELLRVLQLVHWKQVPAELRYLNKAKPAAAELLRVLQLVHLSARSARWAPPAPS